MTLGGLTSTGFTAPTVDEIVQDINTQLLADVDAGLDLAPDQPIGQIIGSFAEKLAEVWEAFATVYNALNPDDAEGNLLDNVSAITGTRRRTATYSTVGATLNINAFTTVPAGSIASVSGQPANRWVLEADAVNSGASPANISGTFRSEQPGPFAANAGTLTIIATPVIGWNSVTNAADAVQGILEDTDTVLRQEREAELSAAGAGTVDAIRARVLLVPGVIQAYVFENTSLITDSNGVPGKAFRVVIWDGASPQASNTAIGQAIWDSKPSGIQSFGATSVAAIDSLGGTRTVYFDRAQQVRVYMSLTTTPGATTAQKTAIALAMTGYGQANFNLGVSVIALAFRAQALTVTGITDVPVFTLGTTASPSGTTNIPISNLQIATLASGDITISP